MVNKVNKVHYWHDLVEKTQLEMVQKYFICEYGSKKIHAKEGGTLVGKNTIMEVRNQGAINTLLVESQPTQEYPSRVKAD
jgi:hypothetical protein